MREALSRHAEEAFAEASAGRQQLLVERMFRALTDIVDRSARRHGVPVPSPSSRRSPRRRSADVAQVVELFRRPGRSFLMPPVPAPLTSGTIVDISHESLMRCWTRLRGWAEEERAAATVYLRLTRAAQWYEDGTAGLWRDPELGLGLKWRAERHPTEAWARRYDESFDRAMRFPGATASANATGSSHERRAERRRQWRRLQWVAAVLALLLFVTGVTAYVATRESRRARAESARAERNLQLARYGGGRIARWSWSATRRGSASTSRRSSDSGASCCRRRSGSTSISSARRRRARTCSGRSPLRSCGSATSTARSTHRDGAVADYQAAVKAFTRARRRRIPDAPSTSGRSPTPTTGWARRCAARQDRYAEAKAAYDTALDLTGGRRPAQTSAEQQQALARVRYNRGILLAATRPDRTAPRSTTPKPTCARPSGCSSRWPAASDADRRAGSRTGLQQPRQRGGAGGRAHRGSARPLHRARCTSTKTLRAASRPIASTPWSWCSSTTTCRPSCATTASRRRRCGATCRRASASSRWRGRRRRSASSAPTATTCRAGFRQAARRRKRHPRYQRALELFVALGRDDATRRFPEFHERFGDLLVNLAELAASSKAAAVRKLLTDGVREYAVIAEHAASGAAAADARVVRDTVMRVRAALDGESATLLDATLNRLRP